MIRAIFSPDNIRANNTLKSNTFKGPPEKDEVSVDRLQYTTEEKCEENGRKIAEESAKKTFIGFAYVKAEAIRNAEADVIGTPRKIAPINLAHADIKIGFIRERGKELPAEYQLIVDEITKASTVKIINN